MAREVNSKGLELIRSFEQKRLKAYQGAADAPGVYTIGYGHVITGHEAGTHGIELFKLHQMMKDVSITDSIAEELFEKDIALFAKGLVMRLPKDVVLTDDQFSALVSLAFNIGLAGFGKSMVLQLIKDGNIEGADYGFKSWIRSGGEVRNGLIRRRAAEKALYRSDYVNYSKFLESATPATIGAAKQYLGLGG